jgi:oxygen-independent coproporphyrinogen-3 oxidase
MFGIYLHIPFCKKACNYCDFHFSTSFKSKSEIIECLNKELVSRKNELQGKLKTIYFGGGTPSVLSKEELNTIIFEIKKHYSKEKDIEITFECNPEDLSINKLKHLKEAGVTRLSIGVQSFDDKVLKWMNRAHNSEKALKGIRLAQELGFDNISIDLIYGIPEHLKRNWELDIQKAIGLNIQHISSYNLTKEKHTSLYNDVKKGEYSMPDQDFCSQEYMVLTQNLTNAGFNQYEVSSFSLNGFESKHNSSYWSSIPYLGIGPSAHSYDGIVTRRWNVSNNKSYVSGILNNNKYFETEKLSNVDIANEIILLGLRSNIGVSLDKIKKLLTKAQLHVFNKQVVKLKDRSLIVETKKLLLVDVKSRILADYIARELFILAE